MVTFFKSLYLGKAFFWGLIALAFLFLASYWFSWLYPVAWIFAVFLFLLSFMDAVALFRQKKLIAKRSLPEKLSNSDENSIQIIIKNTYRFTIFGEVIDEIPIQFQKRDFLRHFEAAPQEEITLTYYLRPNFRGAYHFGKLNVYTSTLLKLVKRRWVFDEDEELKVYPSFVQMKKLDFLAIHPKVSPAGIKKVRRIGHSMEFEQIKEYVPGDDVRTINWKATAKHAELMVNQFQDEKSQPIYSVIDTGRVMKMPFEGLSLLDYSINSALAFSNVALRKKDKVGLVSFSHKLEFILKASSRYSQLNHILENLYRLPTKHLDSDFGKLYGQVKKQITHRSLLMLYTNFEHISALQRQLPYLKAMAKKHVLVVIFFENTEVQKLAEIPPRKVRESAEQSLAEQFSYDKKYMAKELERHGIISLLTPPKDLSINAINTYLEVKARGML